MGILALLTLLLAGCATPYQAQDWMGIGYDEVEVEPGVYFLSYTGDYYHSRAMVVGYWHRRAKELCPEGFIRSETEQGTGPGGAAIGGTTGGVFGGAFLEYPEYSGYIQCQRGLASPGR